MTAMSPNALVASLALAVVVAMMLIELAVSRANERRLFERGAVEAPDPVYRTMRWAYPLVFVAMAIEGAWFGPVPGASTVAGAAILVAAKGLKVWAIGSLGVRWSYRVLVLPGAPLVSSGPYRWMQHPNYVAVVGELLGMAVLVGARVAGPAGVAFFGWLLWRRIQGEERALGLE